MRIVSAASWIKRRGLSLDSNSIGFAHAAPVLSSPPPRCLCGCVVFPFHFCSLASSMMLCRHRIRFRSCLPSRDTRPVICLSCGLSPLCLPLRLSLRLSCRIASLRLSPRPSYRRAGRCRICGRDRLAFLARAMWYRVGGGSGLLAS